MLLYLSQDMKVNPRSAYVELFKLTSSSANRMVKEISRLFDREYNYFFEDKYGKSLYKTFYLLR